MARLERKATVSTIGSAAFEFDDIRPSFEQPGGGGEGLLGGFLEAAEGQVGHYQRPFDRFGDDCGMVLHLFKGDAQRVGITGNHHADAVADENGIEPGIVGEAGEGVVIGGDDRHLTAFAFRFFPNGQSFTHVSAPLLQQCQREFHAGAPHIAPAAGEDAVICGDAVRCSQTEPDRADGFFR